MQQLKVYISSTYEDLKEYREAVYDVLRKVKADVIAMEDYVAQDQRPLQKCLDDVASSDIYIGIFAWRYGYIPNDKDNNPNNLSITELEYRKAKEKGIPCLIFLLDETVLCPEEFVDGTSQSGTTRDNINRLLNELKQNHSVSFFRNEDNLASNVLAALNSTEIRLQNKKSQLLRDYLDNCILFIDKKNPFDNKSLNEIFIKNRTILLDIEKWDWKEDRFFPSGGEEWDIDKFLWSKERYILLGATFGTGKTAFTQKLASDLSKEYIKNQNKFLPIYVPLQNHLNDIDDNGNNLETILSYISDKNTKILFIFDALDEYGSSQDITDLYNSIINKKLQEYTNSKFLITSRLNAGIPLILGRKKYVRLLPFNDKQINEFFKINNIPIQYSTILEAGLSVEESSKPLYCRMVALIYNKNGTIILDPNMKINKTLLYFEVIHNIILGKDFSTSEEYDYEKHYTNEKRVLRKIAELKYIYETSLTVKSIFKIINTIKPEVNEEFIKVFDRLISTYFYIDKDKRDYEQRIDFIHKSFVEYLLAEFYLECCFKNKLNTINMSTLNFETISFLEGLLYILKGQNGDGNNSYFNRFIRAFELENYSKDKLRNDLIQMAELNFENEQNLISDEKEYPNSSTIVSYENLQNHRWISILILNNLSSKYKINNKKFFKFIISTNNRILGNVITIENIDLSNSELNQGLGNYNLSHANLAYSTFHGSFYGTQFVGADLTFCKIMHGTKFANVDFTKADLSDIKIIGEKDASPFVAHFVDCVFSECKLINADLTYTDLALSKFYKTNFSGTILRYANISLANMTNIIIDDKTNTKDINLLSKGHCYEWEDVRKNKELLQLLFEDFDKKNFDERFKFKILQDNPDYNYKNSNNQKSNYNELNE